jgi:hypothetical protein
MDVQNKTISLNELFTDKKEQEELTDIINKRNSKKLREWLNEKERKEMLEKKGVLSDYLYYYLYYKFFIL